MTSPPGLAVLVQLPPLMLPAPDAERLVFTIINDTTEDLTEIVSLEHRRHFFLNHTLGRIHERAHIIDSLPEGRAILVRRIRNKFGQTKAARWGVGDRKTHQLLLKIAAPKMIKETRFQHHLKLTKAIEAGVAPSEAAFVDWIESEKRRKPPRSKEKPKPNVETGSEGNRVSTEPSPPSDDGSGSPTRPTGKVRFQRALDEFAFTVPAPGGEDPVIQIQTPHREKFPERVGLMIFREVDDSHDGFARQVHQLGLVTDFDAIADAILACLKERNAYWRERGRLNRRHVDSLLRKIKVNRARSEEWAESEPEPAPYTQEQIDNAPDEDERLGMELANAIHAEELKQYGIAVSTPAAPSPTSEVTSSEGSPNRAAETAQAPCPQDQDPPLVDFASHRTPESESVACGGEQ